MRTTLCRAAAFLVAGLVFCVTAAPSRAANGIVYTKTGATLKGDVTEGDKTVTVVVGGISTTLKREDVKDIQYVLTIRQQFDQRRGALADNDIDGRCRLVDWLLDQPTSEADALDLASKEIDSLAQAAPDNERVKLLKGVVDGRIRARISVTPKPPQTQTTTPPNNTTTTPPVENGKPVDNDLPRLTAEQINTIKVYELDIDSHPPPTVNVSKEAQDLFIRDYATSLTETLKKMAAEPRADRLYKKYANDANSIKTPRGQSAFHSERGIDQLRLMMAARARDLYGKVQVADDPPSIRMFRNGAAYRVVLSYCATVACHGGDKGGPLYLFNGRGPDDTTVYTNFYILDRYESDAGNMIDREKPEMSLLLNYGLPRNSAKIPHPDVPNFAPRFANERSAEYTEILRWIRADNEKDTSSLLPSALLPVKHYGIDYTPPTPGYTPPPPTPKPQPEVQQPAEPEMAPPPETPPAPPQPPPVPPANKPPQRNPFGG